MQPKARILTYHRIGYPRNGKSYEAQTVLPQRFKSQLQLIRLLGFGCTDMDTVARWLQGGSLPCKRPIVLSFDDGYRDLYEHAFPLLKREGLSVIIYIVSDCREDEWRRTESPLPLQLLDWNQIREMAESGITFGSHTRTHKNLTRCTPEQLRDEVLNSKKIIEDKLSKPVQHFCYPFGATNDQVVDAVREAGYITACTTRTGTVLRGADPLRLPRLTIGKRMGLLKFFKRVTLKG